MEPEDSKDVKPELEADLSADFNLEVRLLSLLDHGSADVSSSTVRRSRANLHVPIPSPLPQVRQRVAAGSRVGGQGGEPRPSCHARS